MKRLMQRFASSGEIGAPCDLPRAVFGLRRSTPPAFAINFFHGHRNHVSYRRNA